MTLSSLLDRIGVPVTILNPTTATDGRGDTIEDWSDPTTCVQLGKFTQTGTSRNVTPGRDSITDSDTIHLPACAPVTRRSRYRVAGAVWESDGEPYLSPTGSHWRVRVKRVQG